MHTHFFIPCMSPPSWNPISPFLPPHPTTHPISSIPINVFTITHSFYISIPINPFHFSHTHCHPFLSTPHHHFHFYPLISIKPMPLRLHGHAWPAFANVSTIPLHLSCSIMPMCMKPQVHGHLYFFHPSYPYLHSRHHHSLSRNINRVSLSFKNHIPSMRFTYWICVKNGFVMWVW